MKCFFKNTMLLLLLLSFLSSCGIVSKTDSSNSMEEQNSLSKESENQAMKYQEYFDNTKDHHPTEEQIMSVCSGMTLSDAIDIIGKPHGFGPTSGIMTLEWEADTGKVYVAMVALPDEKIDIGMPSTVENILSYGVILATPSILQDNIHNK